MTSPMTTSMTTSRIQLALNVADIEAATKFYADLFGVQPAKQRPGYANFVVADPPLKLVLFENAGATSPLNHLGVEVASSEEVGRAATQLRSQGFSLRQEEGVTCCHAVQDKVWVDDPDGAPWEFYTVLADAPQAVTIVTHLTFADTTYGTFEATGPICSTGTVSLVDAHFGEGPAAFNVNVRQLFVCDDNSGTFPIQSERFYMALKGHGATVRYVTLPNEAHGYAARESVLHTVAEMLNWSNEFVKNAKPRSGTTTQQQQ